MKGRTLKRYFLRILKFGFGFAIFGYFLASGKIDLSKVQSAFFHSPWTLLSLLMGGVAIGTMAARWKLLIESQGIPMGFLKALKLVFIGYFFNMVIPGTISGDVIKVYYITRRQENRMVAGFSVFMDRLVGLFVLIIMTFLVMMINYSYINTIPELKMMGQGIAIAFAIVCVGISFFIYKKEFSLSERYPFFSRHATQVCWAYRKQLNKVFSAVILTVFNYFISVLMFYAAARAMGETLLPFSRYLFLVPIGFFVMAIPLAPASVGVGQGIFLKLFEWTYGRPVTIGADSVTLYQIVMVCWAGVGLCVYLFSRHRVSERMPSDKEGVWVTS